jgi:phosphoserine aminotransferase
MLALSPRAVERLLSHKPAWPMPKLFRMTSGGKLSEGLFRGETINTPSLLAVEDQLDALCWAETQGGLKALIARSEANFRAVERWVAGSGWIDFLAEDPKTRSTTSICLKLVDPWFAGLSPEAQAAHLKSLIGLMEEEEIAYDIGAYRDAPAGLRLWGGATVETSDLEALFPWLDWAHGNLRRAKAA